MWIVRRARIVLHSDMTDDPTNFAVIDWSDCPLVMADPDGGDWLVTKSNPRTSVEGVIVNILDDERIETVAYMFEVDVDEVRAILQYYQDRVS